MRHYDTPKDPTIIGTCGFSNVTDVLKCLTLIGKETLNF